MLDIVELFCNFGPKFGQGIYLNNILVSYFKFDLRISFTDQGSQHFGV